MAPFGSLGMPVFTAEVSYLGAAEVRDMSKVPADQLVHFPKRTAGQVRAWKMLAGTRLRWRIGVGQDGYFSFIPLGSEADCPCTYRVGVREGPSRVKELFRIEAERVSPFSPATAEIDLSEYAGREIELLLQLDGPPEVAGQPIPSALWGSPALYRRETLPRKARWGGSAERPNILLVGLDTLRADALGPWGRNPSLSPAIDRLAEESDVWLDAYSTFNSTNPSFASMMTGLYGKNHGVFDLRTPLPQSHVTLAEHLTGAGYESLAVISARHLGDHNSGLGQGFGQVVLASEHHSAEMAVDTTLDWIDARRESPRPFFTWLHLFDPHTPNTPPHPYALGFRPASAAGLAPVRSWVPFRTTGPRAFSETVLGGHPDLYAGEVAYLDRQLGRLLDFLEGCGLLETTLVVLVADHGESLGEHGILCRHIGLHDTTTHVPLMIRWPGPRKQGRRIEGLVSTVDLFPTLLRSAGLDAPPRDGEDLRDLTGGSRTGRRAVFAEHAGRLGAHGPQPRPQVHPDARPAGDPGRRLSLRPEGRSRGDPQPGGAGDRGRAGAVRDSSGAGWPTARAGRRRVRGSRPTRRRRASRRWGMASD